MKKVYILILVALFTICNVQAQKAKITQGSLGVLKGETELHFEFDYSKVQVDGLTETNFVNKKAKEMNKEKKGSGDEFKEKWENSKETLFNKRLVEDVNKELTDFNLVAGEFEDANYKAVVKSVLIYPGYIAGPFSKPATVTATVSIVKMDNSAVVAVMTIKEAKSGSMDLSAVFSGLEFRVGAAYSAVGEAIGEAIVKALKKAK